MYAVKNNYWYQMYIDDLPVWGIVGDEEGERDGPKQYYIWTHKKFDIGYNGDQIVDINLTSDGKVLREPDVSIAFSCEVNWVESDVPFKKRFDKCLGLGQWVQQSCFVHKVWLHDVYV